MDFFEPLAWNTISGTLYSALSYQAERGDRSTYQSPVAQSFLWIRHILILTLTFSPLVMQYYVMYYRR
jgi:hypothetical protein